MDRGPGPDQQAGVRLRGRSGPKNMYLMYHEELESLAKFYPEIKRIRFWMTFGDSYLKHLDVLGNVGMTGSSRSMFQGREIIPIAVPEGPAARAVVAGSADQGQDQYRHHRHRREGRRSEDGLRQQHLRPRRSLCRDRQPGGQLHHRRAGHDRRGPDADRPVEGRGRVQHGAAGSRSVHGHAEPARPAVEGRRSWTRRWPSDRRQSHSRRRWRRRPAVPAPSPAST